MTGDRAREQCPATLDNLRCDRAMSHGGRHVAVNGTEWREGETWAQPDAIGREYYLDRAREQMTPEIRAWQEASAFLNLQGAGPTAAQKAGDDLVKRLVALEGITQFCLSCERLARDNERLRNVLFAIFKRCEMANEADWDQVAPDCMQAAREALEEGDA